MPSKRAFFRRIAPLVAAASVGAFAVVPSLAGADAAIDLTPPGGSYSDVTFNGTDIGVLIQPVENITVVSVGIDARVRTGSGVDVVITPYSETGWGSQIGHGRLPAVPDDGRFAMRHVMLDKPVPLSAGARYDLRFTAPPNGWANDLNEVHFFVFDPAFGDAPFTKGQVTVVDGGGPFGVQYTYTNPGLPHVDITLGGDSAPPTLAPTVAPNPVALGGTAVASPNASDPSGVASQSCDPVDTSVVGAASVLCTAMDDVGNVATATASYRVVYDFEGFFSPVRSGTNVVNPGSAVPLKFSLDGYRGMDVVKDVKSTCSEVNGGLAFNAESGTYTYIWKTDRSSSGPCDLTLTLKDDEPHVAHFQFGGASATARRK